MHTSPLEQNAHEVMRFCGTTCLVQQLDTSRANYLLGRAPAASVTKHVLWNVSDMCADTTSVITTGNGAVQSARQLLSVGFDKRCGL
eukprot:5880998-Amphidinium_carterae.3